MPYIPQDQRKEIDTAIDFLLFVIDKAAGAEVVDARMNYTLTKMVRHFYPDNSYDSLSNGIKLLECVKLEYYRTMVAPYEDKKIEENGDV